MAVYNPLDTVRGNIRTIEEHQESISAEILLDFIVNAFTCAEEYNKERFSKADDFSKFQVTNKELYIQKLSWIASALESSSKQNANVITSVRESLKEFFAESSESLTEVSSQVGNISLEIDKARKQREQLEAQKTKLSQENGHLLRIKGENDGLRNKIKELSDPALLGEPKEKERLEEKLAELEKAISEFETLKSDVEKKEGDKKSREQEELTLQSKKEALDRWLNDYEKRAKELPIELQNAQAQTIVMQNAWNSIKHRKELPALWESFEEIGSDVPREIHNFDDLSKWFDWMGNEIRAMLTDYETTYRKIVVALDSMRSKN